MKYLTGFFSFLWNHKRLSAGIIILLIGAFIFWPRPKPPVPTQAVTRGDFVQTLSVSGTIVAQNSVNLTFPVSGKITWIGVKLGDSVQIGQTIATLDQQIALKNLRASLISYSLQRNTFDQTQSNNLNHTPQDALNDDMKRILQDNQYNLDQAVNSVELQNLAQQQAILSSPITGIVTRMDSQEPGPDAIAGSTTFTVTDPTSIKFEAEVDQADIGKVALGMPVQIIFDAYPNETVTQPASRIDFISHTTSNGGNAFNVETQLSMNNNYKYRVGMNGNADIILNKKTGVLSVPLSSIVGDNQVWVKQKNGFVKQKISIGLENDTDAEVLGGIQEGNIVALDPQAAATQAVK